MHAIFEDRYYGKTPPVVAFTSRNMHFRAHWHTDIEVLFICKGSLLVGINNESQVLTLGDMAICSSGDIHFYDHRGMDSVIDMMIFRPDLIDSAGGWPRTFAFDAPFIPNGKNRDLSDRFHHAFATIQQETKDTDQASSMLIRSSLLSLCGLLARTVPSQPLAMDKMTRRNHRLKGMQDVLSFLESHFTEDILLEDAAAVANMSVCHFSRLFGSITGMGYRSYLNQLRVNRAEELLKNSEESIADIAFKCGFGSIRSFNRIFMASKGVPPSRSR